jgi:hypothetical protein
MRIGINRCVEAIDDLPSLHALRIHGGYIRSLTQIHIPCTISIKPRVADRSLECGPFITCLIQPCEWSLIITRLNDQSPMLFLEDSILKDEHLLVAAFYLPQSFRAATSHAIRI